MLINQPIKLDIYFSFSFTYDCVYVSMMYGVLMPLPVCEGEGHLGGRRAHSVLPFHRVLQQQAPLPAQPSCRSFSHLLNVKLLRYISVRDMYGELS